MKKGKLIIASLIVTFSLLAVLVACTGAGQGGDTDKNPERKPISISLDVPEKNFIIGEINYSDINVLVRYSDGQTETHSLTESMIHPSDRLLLSKPGMWQIRVSYLGLSSKMSLNIVNASDVFYTLTIIGGYVSAVNGKELVSPVIPEVGKEFTEQYLAGTVLTVQWTKEKGRFFSYWTRNDVKVSENSIIEVVLSENVSYRAYSGAVVNTVSFVTGFEEINLESITTDILNAADIRTLTMDGYVFGGWTTDKIDETEARSSYSKNLISFPYSVGRDTVLYGVWNPIGISYKKVDGGYSVSSFNGKITELSIPERYLDLPVVSIENAAFATEQGKHLTRIVLSKEISEVKEGAFKNCVHLRSIQVDVENKNFISRDGVLYTYDCKRLVAYPSDRVDTVYSILSEADEIAAYAFYNAAIGGVIVNAGIEKINECAFYSKHIDYVDFYEVNPNGMRVEDNLFNENLTAICLNAGMRDAFSSLGESFAKNVNKYVTNRNNLDTLGFYSTREPDGLLSRVVYRVIRNKNFDKSDETAEIIAVGRDLNCYTLQIKFNGYYVTSIAKEAFASCDYLTAFTIPSGSVLERIDDDAFKTTPWAKNLVNDTITANFIFYKYLGNQKRVAIDGGILKIADGAFKGKKELEYLDISNNSTLKEISAYAFYGCSSLKGFITGSNAEGNGIYLKKDIEKIGAYAFYETKILSVNLQKESVIATSSWKEVGEYAFAFCDELMFVDLSSKLSVIEPSAFLGCYSLECFNLAEFNSKYEVYDGILYEKVGSEYILCAYPAGRLDAEFNPSQRKNYATSMVRDENEYLKYDNNGKIGYVIFNGLRYDLWMSVPAFSKDKLNSSVAGSLITVKQDGALLKETTGLTADGKPNGEKYYYIFRNGEQTYLFYDKEKSAYYFDLTINVCALGDYSLHFSNIAALRIPDTVEEIYSDSISIPGLSYVIFDSTPTVRYSEIFRGYEPDYIVLPETLANTLDFYGNDPDLRELKNIAKIPYVFFYNYDANTGAYDKSVLYSYREDAIGTVKTAVVRTSRALSELTVPETVVMYIDGVCQTVASAVDSKLIMPFSFFGAKLKTVTLEKIEDFYNDAFTMAYNMTTLYNTSIVNINGKEVFGSKFDNGLFIHDYKNGADLYESWGMAFFSFYSVDGTINRASKYLISDPRGAFAVLIGQDENISETLGVYYGVISELDMQNLKESNLKIGYAINELVSNDYTISVDSAYTIPYNMVFYCSFVPDTYDVYLYSSPSVKFDFEVVREDISGGILYHTTVTYNADYSFMPTINENEKNVFWRLEDGTRILSEGVWSIAEQNEIYLTADFGYRLHFDTNNGATDTFVPECEYAFNGEILNLGIPDSSDGRAFVGWQLVLDGNEKMITDANGISLSKWSETEYNDYVLCAIWE